MCAQPARVTAATRATPHLPAAEAAISIVSELVLMNDAAATSSEYKGSETSGQSNLT